MADLSIAVKNQTRILPASCDKTAKLAGDLKLTKPESLFSDPYYVFKPSKANANATLGQVREAFIPGKKGYLSGLNPAIADAVPVGNADKYPVNKIGQIKLPYAETKAQLEKMRISVANKFLT